MRAENIRQRQKGAILVVSLLMLLVMTVLALSASTSTRLQERMAGNSRDVELAFQGSEAGLRDAERGIQQQVEANGMRMISLCTDAQQRCVVGRPAAATDYFEATSTWWVANSRPYGDPAVQEFDGLVTDPLLRSELWVTAGDSLTDGAKPNQQSGTAYFVNTSRSVGGTATAEVVVQSVYAAAYVE
jgi:type IV pilus assembly protein PilX